MDNIQIKNIPQSLHKRLREHVQKKGCTINDFILEAIEPELVRGEWQERFSKRSKADLGTSAASILEQERKKRDDEMG